MSKIYIINLYECYALDGFVKTIGHTISKEKADQYEKDYENNEDFYVMIVESTSLDN